MTTMASQITSLTVVYSTVYSDADKKQTSKLCVTGLSVGNSPGPVNSPHKGPVTQKMFPFEDVIMWRGYEHHLVYETHRAKFVDVSVQLMNASNPTMLKSYYNINYLVLTHFEAQICKRISDTCVMHCPAIYTWFRIAMPLWHHNYTSVSTLIARFMWPPCGPSGADRTQLGAMLAPGTLLSGEIYAK